MVEKKISLNQIVSQRGLSKGTIFNHLMKLLETHPGLDLEMYRPEETMIEKVRVSLAKQKGEEVISSKKIYDDLNGELTYDDIRQALIFLHKP